jgi:adenine-specific DNA-methyltransferase
MIYIDPPYGIRYGSNFQPFVNKRDVKDGKDEDLTQEPEMIKAFRDTWELGIHSYLAYLRDRLLLANELLSESGSIFLQIGDENLHFVRGILSEVFGAQNFVSLISFVKTASQSSRLLPAVTDFLIHFAKNKEKVKYHQIYRDKRSLQTLTDAYSWAMDRDGTVRRATEDELRTQSSSTRLFRLSPLASQSPGTRYDVTVGGKTFRPEPGYWKTDAPRMEALIKANRIHVSGNTLF